MHLSALRLRGFKSFRDPLELRFEGGVSVVVGPNGSGKSNIADALQWAMASQPPSQLRAQTGQDVLFAGSEQHAASGRLRGRARARQQRRARRASRAASSP